MAKGKRHNFMDPLAMASMVPSGGRHDRRAAESEAHKEAEKILKQAGGSLPAAKKALRRRRKQ